jgi:hypothetical protein
MPATNWSAGSLRITSRTLGPADISARLGITPDRQFERGSLTSPRNPDSLRRETSVWIRTSGLANDRWPEDHVAALLTLLTPHRDALTRLSADCDLDLLLGFSSEDGQGSCVLPARMLTELGALGIDIILDLYPHAVDNTTQA